MAFFLAHLFNEDLDFVVGQWGSHVFKVVLHHLVFPRGGDEKQFINQYLQAREDWLKSSANELVRRTTYRMDAFQTLVANGNWELDLPLIIRGVAIPAPAKA